MAWVIVDRFSKSTNFIFSQMTYSMDKLAELYVYEIAKLHRVPSQFFLRQRYSFHFSLLEERAGVNDSSFMTQHFTLRKMDSQKE